MKVHEYFWCSTLTRDAMSLTMPSSVAADDDNGGEGVDDLNDEAPELESVDGGRSLPELGDVIGEHDNFINSIAAEHSVMTSSSSMMFSLVRRLRDLGKEP